MMNDNIFSKDVFVDTVKDVRSAITSTFNKVPFSALQAKPVLLLSEWSHDDVVCTYLDGYYTKFDAILQSPIFSEQRIITVNILANQYDGQGTNLIIQLLSWGNILMGFELNTELTGVYPLGLEIGNKLVEMANAFVNFDVSITLCTELCDVYNTVEAVKWFGAYLWTTRSILRDMTKTFSTLSSIPPYIKDYDAVKQTVKDVIADILSPQAHEIAKSLCELYKTVIRGNNE